MISNMPGSVNLIQWARKVVGAETPEIEVTIKNGEKVLYHNKVYSVIMNMVQGGLAVNEKTGEVDGDSQVFAFGHPLLVIFAYDQLKMKLQKHFDKWCAEYGINLDKIQNAKN